MSAHSACHRAPPLFYEAAKKRRTCPKCANNTRGCQHFGQISVSNERYGAFLAWQQFAKRGVGPGLASVERALLRAERPVCALGASSRLLHVPLFSAVLVRGAHLVVCVQCRRGICVSTLM